MRPDGLADAKPERERLPSILTPACAGASRSRLPPFPVCSANRDREYLGDKFIAGRVYYNEFLRPNELNNPTSDKLRTLNGYATYLSLLMANTAAYPQPAQFELFRRVLPALKTACQLHARFEPLRDTIKYQSAVMERFNVKPVENAVAELLVRGMTPDECALHLGVAIATIGAHLSALYRKTLTRNQAELLLIIRAIHG